MRKENQQEFEERERKFERYLPVWLVLGVVFFAVRGFTQDVAADLPSAHLAQEAQVANPSCENLMLGEDFEQRYQSLRQSLESDFQSGPTREMREQLMGIRKNLDRLSVEVFTLESKNDQEYLHFTHQVLQALESLIVTLPKASALAPKIRDQYVVPFTNLSSLRADYQDCMMKVAIEEAQAQVQSEQSQDQPNSQPLAKRGEVYKGLVDQLTELNKNLYALETSNVQKLIDLRAQVSLELEQMQTAESFAAAHRRLSQKLPEFLNSAQNEVERTIPGLELSQDFYSFR